jgi:hypothetical protein
MNIVQMIVNAILTMALPIFIWIGYWLAQYQIQRMPQQQRSALEQFSKISVQYVEYAHHDAENKRALALAFASALFEEFKLPVPPSNVLEIAVGAATFEVTAKTQTLEGR